MNKVIVDVDSTLFGFDVPLYKLLVQMNVNIPIPSNWHKWCFWEDYMEESDFYKAVNSIHSNQLSYSPFSYARELLQSLHRKGLYVVIASHRDNDQLGVLKKWLEIYDLYYDEIHVSHDKKILFDENVKYLIDDCPETITYALEKGIKCISILYSWNKQLIGTGIVFKKNLKEIYNMVKTGEM